jgi:hypothetical protein
LIHDLVLKSWIHDFVLKGRGFEPRRKRRNITSGFSR